MFKRLISSLARRRREAAGVMPSRPAPSTPGLIAGSALASPSRDTSSSYDSGFGSSSFDPMPAAIAFSTMDFASTSDSAPAWSGYDSSGSSDFSGGGGDFGTGGSDGGW